MAAGEKNKGHGENTHFLILTLEYKIEKSSRGVLTYQPLTLPPSTRRLWPIKT